MTIRIARAEFGDIAALSRFPLPKLSYQRLAALVVAGAYGAFDDEAPVALGGFYQWPSGAAREAWIRVSPDLGSRFAAVVLGARKVLEAEAAQGPPIVARIAPGNARGQRLATALGFRAAGETVEGAELWRLS